MDQDPSMFLPMSDFGTSNPLSPFNMELLMTSIVNNDELVRSYQEKCAENSQIQQNLESITESAQQVQQMYTIERERKDQLQMENADLIEKLNRLQARLETVENEHVNTDTLNKQTIAELEETVEQSNKKYLEMCELFVEQANILSANSLSTLPLSRKCTAIKEILHTNGIQFEWKSPSKQRRKSAFDKAKTKTTRTCATQTDQPVIEPNKIAPKPVTHEKGTQYQQSKATRSTCTSAFIHTTEVSTNTENENENETLDINLALEKMVSYPTLLSPIHEERTSKVATNTTNTQTIATNYRTQGTLTLINNVRKRVNYVRARTKSDLLSEVKKEEYLSPCASPGLIFPSSTQDDPAQVATQFHHYWQMTGELLCRMHLGQNMLVDENQLNDTRIIQKFREMQNLIAEGMHRKSVDNIALNGDDDGGGDGAVHCAESIDCQDEHSRDSVESYNSAKIIISKFRNLSNCSPSLLDENISSYSATDNGDKQNVFTPIAPIVESSRIESELQENRVQEKPQSPKQPAIASRIHRRDKNEPKIPSNHRTLALNKGINVDSCNSSKSAVLGNQSQIENEVHFKVPKRKKSTAYPNIPFKRRNVNNVSEMKQASSIEKLNMISNFQKKPEKHLMTSILGDIKDDDDNDCDIAKKVQKILSSIQTPKMLSPIKDWCGDVASPSSSSSPLMTMNIQEVALSIRDGAEQLNAKYENISSEIDANVTQQSSRTLGCTEMLQIDEVPMQTAIVETEQLNLQSSEALVQEAKHDKPVECVLEYSSESNQSPKTNTGSNANTLKSDVDHHDSPNLIIESNNEEIVEFDDFSPASPKPEDQTSSTNVQEIPINTILNETKDDEEEEKDKASHISNGSAIDQIIYNYAPSIRNETFISNFSNAECYLLANLRRTIEKYCIANEWTATATTECVDTLLSLSRQPKHLVTAILEVVEDTKEKLSVEFTPPAPVLQPSHQKCMVLVSRFTKLMPTFSKYLEFELERRLFSFAKEDRSIVVMTNLAHFYVSLIDIERPSHRAKVRLFIYKCLYYFKSSAVALIFTVIMAHPYALPHANEIEFISDPLIRAIVCALSNIIYLGTGKKDNKRNEMYQTLKRRYGFFADKTFSFDVVVDYCIECIRTNHLQHVDYALILIAKRKDYEYAIKQIIEKHLVPVLNQCFLMNLNASTEYDEKICTILFTIGSIVKTFPIEYNVCGFINMFVTCLNATQRQCIQEAAVSAICQLSRFGTAQIYPHLTKWKPNYKISAHIQAILKSIVYGKPKKFWFSGSNTMNNQNN